MSDRSEKGLPPELAEIGELLRDNRPTASALELDTIKLEARARARRRRPQLTAGSRAAGALERKEPMRSRALALMLTVAAIGGTTAGGIAIAGGGGNGGSAADSQYRPGMGCGDKNHTHTGPPGNPNKNPATDCPKGSAQNP